MKLAVVILNYNDLENTIRLTKLFQTYAIVDKIIVVDNCSIDQNRPELHALADSKTDVLVSDRNGGYSYGNNYGLQYLEQNYGTPAYVLISNPDIEVEEQAIITTLDFLEQHPEVGLAAPRIYDLEGNPYLLSGWKFRQIREDAALQSGITTKMYVVNDLERLYPKEIRDAATCYADCISGCFFIIRGALFQKIGYFDDRLFLFGEEDVLGKKVAKEGYRACVLNTAKVIHYESVSINKNLKNHRKRKQIHQSLSYYYRHYDPSVTWKDRFFFSFTYHLGTVLNFVADHLYQNRYYQKLLNLGKRSLAKLRTKKQLQNFYKEYLQPNGKEAVLHLIHLWSDNLAAPQNIGGSVYTVIDIVKNSIEEYNVLVLYPNGPHYRLTLYTSEGQRSINIGYHSMRFLYKSKSYDKMMRKLLRYLKISVVHVHSLIGHQPTIGPIVRQNHSQLVLTLHDFYFFCLNYFLLNQNGNFCEFAVDHCKDCIAHFQNGIYSSETLKEWRALCYELLKNATQVIAPSGYVKETYQKLYPSIPIDVIEHHIDLEPKLGHWQDKKTINIAFLGGISKIKGSELLEKFVKNSSKNSEIKVHLFGISDRAYLNENHVNYTCHGEYKRTDLPQLFQENAIDLVCILSIMPETYSYTLSEAVVLGVPVLGFDIGAIGSRIKTSGCGWLIPVTSDEKVLRKEIKKCYNKKEYQQKLANIEQYQASLISTRKMAQSYHKYYQKQIESNKMR